MAEIQKKVKIDIKRKLLNYIKNNFLMGNCSKTINEEDSFLEKSIIDSTGVLELVYFIEETFGIKVEDEELVPENLDSLNKLNVYIKSKLRRQKT